MQAMYIVKMCAYMIKRMQNKKCKFRVVWLVCQLFCLFVRAMKLCQFYWANDYGADERTKENSNNTTLQINYSRLSCILLKKANDQKNGDV